MMDRGQLIVVQAYYPNCHLRDLFSSWAALQPFYFMGRPRKKSTLKEGGKRVAKDWGQAGCCGLLKLQTKAYLQITEPRGWKRNPPSVIVSHVLPPPVIFSSLKHAPCPYSKDPNFTGENQRNHRTGIAFSTAHEIMCCESCCAWVQLPN